jgi:hypothetical protein
MRDEGKDETTSSGLPDSYAIGDRLNWCGAELMGNRCHLPRDVAIPVDEEIGKAGRDAPAGSGATLAD